MFIEINSFFLLFFFSDDLFLLEYSLGKIVLVGVLYVVFECVGFFVGVGFDVIVFVRFIFLRGFD